MLPIKWGRVPAGLAATIAILVSPVSSQTMKAPTIEPVTIDWPSTVSDFETYRPIVEGGRAQGRLSLTTRAQIAVLKLRFATLRDDHYQTPGQSQACTLADIGLDVAEDKRRSTLLSLAEVAYRRESSNAELTAILNHVPSTPLFVKQR